MILAGKRATQNYGRSKFQEAIMHMQITPLQQIFALTMTYIMIQFLMLEMYNKIICINLFNATIQDL